MTDSGAADGEGKDPEIELFVKVSRTLTLSDSPISWAFIKQPNFHFLAQCRNSTLTANIVTRLHFPSLMLVVR